MTKKKRPARPRNLRRQGERSQQKLAEARRRLLALEPGGSPERPLEVASAAVIEARAESVPCPDCTGPLRVHDHSAQTHHNVLLRAVLLRCRQCGAPLMQFFRIVPTALN